MTVNIKQSPLSRRKDCSNLNIVPYKDAENTMDGTFKQDFKKVKRKHIYTRIQTYKPLMT